MIKEYEHLSAQAQVTRGFPEEAHLSTDPMGHDNWPDDVGKMGEESSGQKEQQENAKKVP